MAQQKLTIFQKLTKTFGFQGQLRNPPQFEFNKEDLLRTDSKDDFERARLQAQQTQYIADKWSKLDMSLYNQSVYYEPNRLSAYYDFESMEFSLHGDTQIVTPNGNVSIKELAERGRDYEFITYAYDHNLKKVIPAWARNAHYTRDDMTYKITFDDNTFIIASIEHRFLKRDGTFCKVKDLKVGDSMMPFYRKSFYKEKKYNWIYSCNPKIGWHGWIAEHTLVAEHLIRPLNENEVVHHLDFNGKNNLPDNLKILNSSEHQAFHARHNNKKLWSNPEYVAKMKIVARTIKNFSWKGKRSGKNNPAYIELPINDLINSAKNFNKLHLVSQNLNISIPKIRRTLKLNGYRDWKDLLEKNNINIDYKIHYGARKGENHQTYKTIPWDLIVETAIKNKTVMRTSRALKVSNHKIMDDIHRAGFGDWQTFIDAYTPKSVSVESDNVLVNHKIKSIEPYGVIPVYDLSVPGYKNFATDTIFSHNTPEISAALDIYSEESTTKSEKGEILSIHSDSKRIKHILDDLFYNILDVNTNLPMWSRGMCKYGDDFVYLKIDSERGVVGCQQLPNIEVERLEGARQSVPNQSDRVGSRFPTRELRFTWKNKDMEFQAWEIAHFRILGDDRRLPYGTCLKYDSYIETEKGHKEIKEINVNDMVYSFNTDTQSKVLSKVLDVVKSGKKTCYKLSTRHNYIDASEEHRILFYNKKTQSFDYKNVLDFKIGDLLVINRNIKDGEEILIDKSTPDDFLKSQNYSEKNKYWNLINEYIPNILNEDFAELFGFLLGDGGISKNTVWFAMGVDDEINNKFISLLQKFSGKIGKANSKKTLFRIHSKMLVVILQRLGFLGLSKTKRIPEWGFRCKHKIKEALINGLYLADGTSHTDKWNCTRYSFELSNEGLIKDIKILIQDLGYKTGKISCRDRCNKEIIIKNKKVKCINKSYALNYYLSYIEQSSVNDIENRLSNEFIVEPIISIENIGEHETFDIYVENEHHNFYANGVVVHNSMLDKIRRIWKQLLLAEDAMLIYRTSRAPERRVFKVFVGNMDDKDIEAYVQRIANKFKRDQVVDQKNGNVDMRYNQMAVDQDYFIPVRDPGQPSPIETLPGAQNLGEIADIEYIQKKMLAALRIPKAFLGFEDVIGNGKGLALLDIRFARTINRIQMSLIQELNKIALIHLFILGFEDELNNFTLSLTNPSGQSDLLKIESWKEKITMYKDATSDQSQMGILPVSHTWAKKNILGMSDNEIILDLQQQRLERAMGFELTNTQAIIRRSGVFDDVDKKYGIPEEERKQIEVALSGGGGGQEAGGMPGGAGGAGGLTSPSEAVAGAISAGPPAPTGAEPGAPLSESRKEKILSMLNEDTSLSDLFNMEKAQKNIYEIEKAIKDILHE